jgi:hypothetical protein
MRGDIDHNKEAPRYQIDFRGLAAYRNLTETTKDAIRSMINGSKNYLFNNHTRDYSLHLVHQMMPVLSGEPASTAWFHGFEGGGTEGKAAVMPVPTGAAAKDNPSPKKASSASTHPQHQNAGQSSSTKRKRARR